MHLPKFVHWGEYLTAWWSFIIGFFLLEYTLKNTDIITPHAFFMSIATLYILLFIVIFISIKHIHFHPMGKLFIAVSHIGFLYFLIEFYYGYSLSHIFHFFVIIQLFSLVKGNGKGFQKEKDTNNSLIYLAV